MGGTKHTSLDRRTDMGGTEQHLPTGIQVFRSFQTAVRFCINKENPFRA